MNLDKVEDFYKFGLSRHDFYRCVKCNRIFTQQHEREQFKAMSERSEEVMFIHCRSLRYQPASPYLWEWLYPSVLIYSAKVILARVIAPKFPSLRTWALTLAGNKTTV